MNTREQALALMHALGLTPDAAETEKSQAAIECALEEAVHRQRIKGGCPACNRQFLSVGAGGRLTCTNADCPDPASLDNLLDQMLYARMGGAPIDAKTGIVKFPGLQRKYERAVGALRSIDFAITDTIGTDGEEPVVIRSLTDRLREIRDLIYSFFEDVMAMQPEQAEVVETTTADTGSEAPVGFDAGLRDALEEVRADVAHLTEELADARSKADIAEADFGALWRDYLKLKEQAERLIRHLDGSDGMPAAWWLEAADAVRQIGRIVWPLGEALDGAEKALPDADEGRR